jgi:purine-nucleoside phosphorylase
MELAKQIQTAVDYIITQTPVRPSVGLILGSGLGDFADTLRQRTVIPFADIPDFPQTTVAGHAGAFVFGTCQGRSVVALQGRLHYYEGHSQQTVTLPVRIMAKLGVKQLIATNASGGVNLDYRPGDLMLIRDHINFSGSNPLLGMNMPEFGPRFPDVSDLYSKDLRRTILAKAEEEGIAVRQGVYMMFSGPNYETPAEIRFARIIGADAVGMSTVPEALVAAQCGMQVVGISCITNMAAGILPQGLNHQEVIDTAALVHDKFHRLLNLVLAAI